MTQSPPQRLHPQMPSYWMWGFNMGTGKGRRDTNIQSQAGRGVGGLPADLALPQGSVLGKAACFSRPKGKGSRTPPGATVSS